MKGVHIFLRKTNIVLATCLVAAAACGGGHALPTAPEITEPMAAAADDGSSGIIEQNVQSLVAAYFER
jgi:hypothetical protein